jgi:hypothetical protein
VITGDIFTESGVWSESIKEGVCNRLVQQKKIIIGMIIMKGFDDRD